MAKKKKQKVNDNKPKRRIIDEMDSIVCPICGETSVACAWENMTKESCKRREFRRDYVELVGEHNAKDIHRAYYRCPECAKMIDGSKLKIIKE